MSETPEQTRARFAEKDLVFAERERTRRWPLLECKKCCYFACMKCGKRTSEALVHENCGGEVRQGVACCQRDYHHIGDCCTHCGNDERNL